MAASDYMESKVPKVQDVFYPGGEPWRFLDHLQGLVQHDCLEVAPVSGCEFPFQSWSGKKSLLKSFSSIPPLTALRYGPVPWPTIPQLWFKYLQLREAEGSSG